MSTEPKKIKSASEFSAKVFIELTEVEARALEAIAGYSVKDFLRIFYEHLGKSYLQPHEKGVASLFSTIKGEIPKHLSRIDKTRKIWNE